MWLTPREQTSFCAQSPSMAHSPHEPWKHFSPLELPAQSAFVLQTVHPQSEQTSPGSQGPQRDSPPVPPLPPTAPPPTLADAPLPEVSPAPLLLEVPAVP